MSTRRMDHDRGSVLPLVLILVVVLGVVVAGLATYAATTLRYGQVVEARTDRLAAADGALREAIERLRLVNGNSPCLALSSGGSQTSTFPELINGATATVTCSPAGSGVDEISQWALILTGNGLGSTSIMSSSQAGTSEVNPKELGGPVFVNQAGLDPNTHFDLDALVRVVEGDVYFPGASCPVDGERVPLVGNRWDITPAGRSGICVDETTAPGGIPRSVSIPNPGAVSGAVDPDFEVLDGCRVFSPGVYTTAPELQSGGNYFKSGNYRFADGVVFTVADKDAIVTVGNPDAEARIALKIPNPDCESAIFEDRPDVAGDPVPGATFYMDGSARIFIDAGKVEFLPRNQGAFDWVSVQTLPSSSLTATSDPLVYVSQGAAGGGNEGKEAIFRGWVWAERAWIDFQNVVGLQAQVQLAGGATLSRIHLGANASAGEFEVSVSPTPARAQYLLRAEATKGDGVSEIVALVDYAPPNNVAVRSWRVVN